MHLYFLAKLAGVLPNHSKGCSDAQEVLHWQHEVVRKGGRDDRDVSLLVCVPLNLLPQPQRQPAQGTCQPLPECLPFEVSKQFHGLFWPMQAAHAPRSKVLLKQRLHALHAVLLVPHRQHDGIMRIGTAKWA